MGEAIFDLEYVLRSKKEPLTLEESNVLLNWRAQAMRAFTVGFGGGSFVTWLATQRLRYLFRYNITFGVAAFCGFWRMGRSVESSVDRILSLEGSRMQTELANIMLSKYSDNPWALRRLSKHFYSEEVYDDSSTDRPKRRWRFRNYFGDHPYGETSHSKEPEPRENDVKKTTSPSSSSSSTTSTQPKQVYVNAAGGDATENPFDLVFGFPETVENVTQPGTLSSPSRREKRREKRSRRRHRRHHQEEESAI